MCERGLCQRRLRLPYVRDGLFVLVVRGPHCDFVPFGAHVNDGSAHVIAEVIKSFAHQTQKLQEEQLAGQRRVVTSEQSLIREESGGRARLCLLETNF